MFEGMLSIDQKSKKKYKCLSFSTKRQEIIYDGKQKYVKW